MKTKRIIGIFLTLAMLMSCICPALAATGKVDKSKYNYGNTVKVTGKSDIAGESLLITVKNAKNDDYSLVDSVEVGSNYNFSYSFTLPSTKNDVWPSSGTYTVEVGGDKMGTFTISSGGNGGNGGSSGGSSSGGSGTGSGSGIVIPGTGLSGNGIVEVILNPNQYAKYGITATNVTTSGNKTTANTFTASVAINGIPVTSFTGYDPVLIKVPYTAPATNNSNNIVVYNQAGTVVPRTLYKDGFVYVNTNNIAGTFTIAEASPSFSDVSNVTHSWAMTGIQALAARDIINGVGNGLYDPDRSVTRAEFIKMIVAMFNVYDNSRYAQFTDVGAEWYNSYIGTAQALGITNGYEDGSFRPNNTITREEMSTMLYRAAEVVSVAIESANSDVFSDDASIQDYAKIPVYKMRGAGILQGVGNNEFDPRNYCTRAQAAVAIYNMFGVSMAR